VATEERDAAGDDVASKLDEARVALRRYLAALAESGEAASVHVDLPADPVEASYRVASLTRVSDPELQQLLDLESAGERLAALTTLLHREHRLLEVTMARKEG
jgi:Lon protease-like protein